MIIATRRWRARGGTADSLELVIAVGVPCGIVGARIYHVITDYQLYFGPGRDPIDALKIWQGGLGVWGAIAFGVLGGWLVARRKKIRFPALLDAVAPGILVAQAIGRLGNWFNQELFGRPTTLPWASGDRAAVPAGRVTSSSRPSTRPSCTRCCGAWPPRCVLVGLDRKFRLGHGKVFALYMVFYTAGRFWIEALRIDTVNEIGGFRLNNYTSLIVFLAALVWFDLAGPQPARPGGGRRGRSRASPDGRRDPTPRPRARESRAVRTDESDSRTEDVEDVSHSSRRNGFAA